MSGWTLSPSFWEVFETKISNKWSQVTPLFELIEMGQYLSGRPRFSLSHSYWLPFDTNLISLACHRDSELTEVAELCTFCSPVSVDGCKGMKGSGLEGNEEGTKTRMNAVQLSFGIRPVLFAHCRLPTFQRHTYTPTRM